MKLEKQIEYLQEVTLGKDPNLNDVFDAALQQVFSRHYYSKINRIIKKRIQLKKIKNRNENIIAYNKGNTIYINELAFYKLPLKQQIQYLIHEFIHLLQRKRKLLFFKEFKEVNNVSDKLYSIAKQNLTRPLSVFLMGRNTKLGAGKGQEVLSYLMNDEIDWSGISPQGKQEFISVIRSSGIFNFSHPFWKKRLT